MGFADIVLGVGRTARASGSGTQVANIIEFVESPWGLNVEGNLFLFPVQRIILKAHYGLELDDKKTFEISDWKREKFRTFTEASYLKYMFEEGRCNIGEVDHERREMVLSIGRRSGKTFLAAAVAAYETYKLLLKGNPQAYYGLPAANNIQIISVATDKDQAGLLYQEASGHFKNCFARETEIITADGIQPIGSLAGTTQRVLGRNGAWVDAPIQSFGKQRLWALTLRRQGVEKVVHCTRDHRWFARDQHAKFRGKGFIEFTTEELRPEKHRLQVVFGHSYKNIVTPSPFGVAHGFTYGDGSTTPGDRNATRVMMIGEKDSNLRPYFALCPQRSCPAVNGVEAGSLPNYFRELPSLRENKAYLLGWLMGYLAADGTVKAGTPSIASTLRSNLEFVRSLCAVIGIGTFSIRKEDRISNLTGRPFTMYTIGLMRSTLDKTFFLIPAHRESFLAAGGDVLRREVREWVVQSVEETDREEEVFCATVEGQHAFVLADNLVTGNCGFFRPYSANSTQSFSKFQTPQDIVRYGAYGTDKTAKATLKVTFKSCIAKGLRGAGNLVVIMDEMAHFTDEGQSSAESVYNAITPSTSTFSPKDPTDTRNSIGPVEGRIISISSPLGRQGQFYTLFRLGMKGGTVADNMLVMEAPTWEVNPTIPASELEKHYWKNPTVFFTEYGARFDDRTKGWIDSEDDLMACVSPTARPANQGLPRRPHFVGLDLGMVGDATAIAIGHVDHEEHIVLDLLDQIKAGEGKYANYERLEFEDIADWVLEHSKRFYIAEGMFDHWAGLPFEQALQRRGLRQCRMEHMTRNLNSDIFKNFKDMMWDKRLILYDHPKEPGKEHCPYILELMELQAETHSKYVIEVHAPKTEGKHDDRSDALVRMVWLASQKLSAPMHISRGFPVGPQAHQQQGGSMGVTEMRKAIMRAKRMGSSPDRQASRSNPTKCIGRRR